MMTEYSTLSLKRKARELGFNLVGVTPAVPSPMLAAYFRWIEAGMHGAMGYMARPDRQERRQDLQVILPGVRSLVMVGLDYASALMARIPSSVLNDPARGRIAAYAWGVDYHEVLTPRLEQLAFWLREQAGQQQSHRVYVDTGPLLERSHAQQAGLGFIGKNTMLIHPRRGSSFFIGEILTDLVFDSYDKPHKMTLCGTCTRCLSACPTEAFPQPHVLDARRCISYHTIENKGWIDRALRPQFGNWVYGCDICQDVCPFQRFAPTGCDSLFLPVDVENVAPRLSDLLALNENAFKARFAGSPLERIKRERLVRNACIAAGNWGSRESVPALRTLLADASPIVRGHAAWALGAVLGVEANSILEAHIPLESDPLVRDEMVLALSH